MLKLLEVILKTNSITLKSIERLILMLSPYVLLLFTFDLKKIETLAN